ncbi:MAG TPA: glycosyltransferase [Ktedonobacteraceae bacterium]|nr:glycosyltransferase [Ktedonobacteraceae bacterium]
MKNHVRKSNWPRLFWWLHALGVAGFYAVLWLRTKPDRTRVSPVCPASEKHTLPRVSIIVPARNEERNIRRCVHSLLEQDYPDYEVIVVDDNSTDHTPEILDEIAHTHPQGARLWVLRLNHLPEGWAGKPHALHAGVQEANGEFLLFTDADTWHAPGALQAAMSRAEEQGLDLLSLVSAQELPGFWERVMMPMAFLGISMQYPVRQVNDPRSPVALANGQYILLRRAVYDWLGGYARSELRGTLVDDRDLAFLVKREGFHLELADGRELVRVRMYRGLREAWRGWRKNVFLGSRGGLFFVLLSLPGLPMVTVLPFLLPLRLWLARLAGKRKTVGIAEAVFLSVLELGPLLTYRRWIDKEMQLPWYYMFTHPLAGSLFVGILAQSTWRIRAGKGVDWSGRRYYLRNSPAKP